MNRRALLVVVALVALLGGVAVIWPRLASNAAKPRFGNWYPDLDPGTRLVVDLADRREEYGLGRHYHYHDVEFTEAALTSTEVQLLQPGGSVTSRTGMESPTPVHTSGVSGSGGYLQHTAPNVARFTFDVVDAGQVRRALHPPIRLPTTGVAIGPSDLVVADDLDLHLRWQTTSTALWLELADPDGDGDPGCALAMLRCEDELVVPFAPPDGATDGRLVAAVALTRLAGWIGRELNVGVALGTAESGARTVTVTLRRP